MTSINDAQFGKYALSHERHAGYDMLTLHKEVYPGEWGNVGNAEVVHRKKADRFVYPSQPEATLANTYDPERAGVPNKRWADYTDRIEEGRIAEGKPTPGKMPGQVPLFLHEHEPASSTVDLMAIRSEKDRAVAGPMLGVLSNMAKERNGVDLSVPDDLSKHSSKLVRNLQSKGLVDKSAPNDKANDMDFVQGDDQYRHTFFRSGDELEKESKLLPRSAYEEGRATFRQKIKEGRKPAVANVGPQFDQLQFRGV